MPGLTIELKLRDPRLAAWGFPHWGSSMAAGLDLFACLDEPIDLAPQAPAILIPAGFSLHIGDANWVGLVYPRSGQGHKRGLVLGNGVGVIDADYQGEVFVSAWNRDKTSPIRLVPGERIAQMVFSAVTRPVFTLVDQFGAESPRGSGGFGSTGL